MFFHFFVLSTQAAPLPALNVDPNMTSVSGLSSGGYFANQYHVAFSASTVGAGVFGILISPTVVFFRS